MIDLHEEAAIRRARSIASRIRAWRQRSMHADFSLAAQAANAPRGCRSRTKKPALGGAGKVLFSTADHIRIPVRIDQSAQLDRDRRIENWSDCRSPAIYVSTLRSIPRTRETYFLELPNRAAERRKRGFSRSERVVGTQAACSQFARELVKVPVRHAPVQKLSQADDVSAVLEIPRKEVPHIHSSKRDQ